MGVAKDYCFNDIKPFVLSLRESGYKGHLVLFVTEIDTSISDVADKYGIELIIYQEIYPYIDNKSENAIPTTFDTELHLVAYRFVIYYLYLLENCGRFANIFLADLRDIVFQKDPFDTALSNNQLYCFLESQELSLKHDTTHNAQWVVDTLGKEALNEIGDKHISCAGTTLGTYDSILDYLKQMVGYLLTTPSAFGCDQAIHNYMIHADKLKTLTLIKNGEGSVLTIGRIPHGTIKIDQSGNLLNSNNSIPNTLHQYDRHPDINQRIMSNYHSLPYRLSLLMKTIAKYKSNPRMILGSIRIFLKYGLKK